MRKKQNIIMTAFLAFTLAAPSAALAAEHKRDDRPGCPGPSGMVEPGFGGLPVPALRNLPAEKQGDFKNMLIEHFSKSFPLHREIARKYEELDYISRLSSAQPKDISAIMDDVRKLENTLFAQAQETMDLMRSEFGLSPEQSFFVLRGAGKFMGGMNMHGKGFARPCPAQWGQMGMPDRDDSPRRHHGLKGDNERYADPEDRGPRRDDRRHHRPDRPALRDWQGEPDNDGPHPDRR